MVVIDSTHLLPVVDSHALAVMSDKVLPLPRSGATERRAIKSSIVMIE
jgi:hypothetical protein